MGRNTEFKAIIFMSLFVAAFSLMSLGSILIGGEAAQAEPISSRQPASLDQAVKKKKVEHKEESLVVNCKTHQDKAFQTKADRVQIKGLNCLKPTKGIVNSTNGYTASTFFPKEGLFLTDFIQLSEGVNRVLLSSANGEFVEVVIKRSL